MSLAALQSPVMGFCLFLVRPLVRSVVMLLPAGAGVLIGPLDGDAKLVGGTERELGLPHYDIQS